MTRDRLSRVLLVAAGIVILAWRLVSRALRRALLTYRPTYGPLAFAVLVVTPTAAALATWATLGVTGRALHMPSVLRVEAAVEPSGDPGSSPTADPRLQDGYALPAPVVPPILGHAAPGGPDDGTPPTWLPAGLAPWWLDIVAAAHEHGLDSHAWGAIVAQECPWGDPACGSYAGARGLAQIMPGTAAEIETSTGLPCRARATDGPTSLRCGAWYFAERVRSQADLWTNDADDENVFLIAAGLYNGGKCGLGIRQAAQRGDGDVCAAATCGETRTYCYAFRDRWRQTLAERGTQAEPTPAYVPPVAPGGPTHLEARTP